MCGIFGVWNFAGITGRNLKTASALLRHRGPDDEGFLIVEGGTATSFAGSETAGETLPLLPDDTPCQNAFLHRRLSILDLSSAGHQPMGLPGRKCYITYNGEVYNFRALAAAHGIKARTGTDTEIILALYDKLGTACFEHMMGMWAIALLDLEVGELILSRDRFGIKPLYYTVSDNALAFASELKPLLQVAGARAEIAQARVLQFLAFGATSDANETFFNGVEALPPGTLLRYNLNNHSMRVERWYDLVHAAARPKSGNFESLFDQSIRAHMVADVEVGSCLSGGLDSSAIVAAAAGSVDGFKTFTVSFPGEHFDESNFARKLANLHPGLEQHFATPSSSDFIRSFEQLVTLQERPIGSASIFAQYAVMQCAAGAGIKVLLDGQGADEVFGGYYPFAGAYLLNHLREARIGTFLRVKAALEHNFNPAMTTAMARAAFYHLPSSFQRILRKRERLGSNLIAPELRDHISKLPTPDRGSANFKTLTYKSITYGLYELLHYEDRNAMHFGIESRVPFLDHRLVEWAVGLSANEKIVDGWTKYPIRNYLDRKGLGDLAWRRDKLGFVAPQERWRRELLDSLRGRVLDSALPAWLDRPAVEALFSKKLQSNSHLSEFWRVTALLMWVDIFGVEVV